MMQYMVLETVRGLFCQVFLFGSHVRGEMRRSSDFDKGITGLPVGSFYAVKRLIGV